MSSTDRDVESLWRTLGRIQWRLGIDPARMADLLELTEAQYLRMGEERRALSALSVLSLAQRLELDPEQIVENRIDWGALHEHFKGNAAYVPERYRSGAFSRRRTSIHVLAHLRRNVGEDYVHDLLRKFNVTEAVFRDPEQTINMRFLTDLADHLEAAGVPDGQLSLMGAETSIVNRNTEFGRTLAKARSVREAYELQINGLMHFYDLNCHYRLIRLTNDHAVIECRPRIEVKHALSTDIPGSPAFCTVRRGVAMAVPRFINHPLARVEEIRCIHRGAPTCHLLCHFVERRRSVRGPKLVAPAPAVAAR